MAGGPVAAYRAMPRYEIGDPGWWLWPQIWFGNHPERALLLLLTAALAMGGCFYWMLRRRATIRLRGRTPVEKAH
jgi:cellulose synthase (UDP-forming)